MTETRSNPKETGPRRVTISINAPWTLSGQDILHRLKSDPEKGLTDSEAKKRRKRFGANRLREVKTKSAWTILLNQFKSLLILVLAAASVLSFALGDWLEGAAIAVAIGIFIVIGFFTELRAVRSIEALRRLGSVSTKVMRDKQPKTIGAQNLVPGDIALFEGGDVVTADFRLIETSKLQADESTLTGESVPVDKHTEALSEGIPLAERNNMLYKGTAVTRGSAKGVAVATGMETELGKVSSLVEETEEEFTPLEKRLNALGTKLMWITLGITVMVAGVGILAGREIFLMVKTAVILAIAAIPEGLPIVATIALARGVWRMAQRNALVERLASVETLGATDVICVDKTGTLTQNRMSVARMATSAGIVEWDEDIQHGSEEVGDGETSGSGADKLAGEILRIGVLCNNADLKDADEATGDPLEAALLMAGARKDLIRNDLLREMPEEREVSFEPDTMMMATFHKLNGKFYVAVKGAPESVLEASSRVLTEEDEDRLGEEDKKNWMDTNEGMADQGLRVLAVAKKEVTNRDAPPYEDLAFSGLVGLQDPPREGIKESIERCRDAGIQVVMVTGDHPRTAKAIGRKLGLIQKDSDRIQSEGLEELGDLTDEEQQRLIETPIFARVTPKQKLDLIGLHRENGSVVAMTGDGVNDAPALKKADIGIAMGKRGTQVAREAADMILKDDAFDTIVAAVSQGRVIFDNIRKFISYLLSCNLGSVMGVGFCSVLSLPLPVTPLQILYLNLVTDVFPAVALGLGEGEEGIMARRPRKRDEPILAKPQFVRIGYLGLIIALAVTASLVLAANWMGMEKSQAVTVSFLVLGFARLWNVFNMRGRKTPILRNDITQNRYVWFAIGICCVLLFSAAMAPGLSGVLATSPLGLPGWGLIAGMSLIPLAMGQILAQRWHKKKSENENENK
jgi:Ca2+-transporting ATPase